MTPNVVAPPRTSAAAIASLVLGVLGLCTCVTSPFAVVFGIVALVKMGKDPGLKGQGLAIAGLVCACASVVTAGILSAIAIPNFIKFQARSKQSEAKITLRMLVTSQQAYRAEHDTYSEDREALGFVPEGRRYDCAISQAEVADRLAKWHLSPTLTSKVGASAEAFTAICVGNVDNDEAFDVWTVSADNPVPDNVYNDVVESQPPELNFQF